MKQLTIYCADELNEKVRHILHHYDLEGFIHKPGLFATRFKPEGTYGKDMTWQANAFILFSEEEQIRGITQEIQGLIDASEIEPCLRIVVIPIELIY